MRRLATAAAGALVISLAACGGNDGGETDTASLSTSTSSTAAAPSVASKEEFVSEANAICAEMNAASAEDPQDLAGYKAAMHAVVAHLSDGQQRLRELSVPPEDAPAIDAWLAANDEQIAAMKEAAAAVEAATTVEEAEAAAVAGAERFGEIAAEQADFATSYGLTECA